MKIKKVSALLLLCSIVTSIYATESVRGSQYIGEDSDGDFYKYEFFNNGVLKYTSPSGTYENATWQQYKHSIFIEKNHHFTNCIGIVNKKSLEFKCWNKNNNFWMHNLNKVVK